MAREPGPGTPSRWVAVAATGLLAIGVVVLGIAAWSRANPAPAADATAHPVPTFSLGVRTPAASSPATPAPAPAPAEYPLESERFLAVGPGALWRATAGRCGGASPLVERSIDGGASWSDVTARYLGIGQVASLDPFAGTEGELVAGLGAGCAANALRTYTQGEFWESYPDVLAVSRFVDLGDAGLVRLGGSATTRAPCPEARGLRATGDVVVLLCDGTPFAWRGGSWIALPAPGAVALAISGGDAVVAHVDGGCSGLALTRFAGADPIAGTSVGCAPGVDAAAPVAIAAGGGGRYLVWSHDTLSTVGE